VDGVLRVIEYGGWAEFKRDLFLELFDDGVFRPGRYLFRGAGQADWPLTTAFDRQFAAIPLERRMALWGRLIQLWREGCREAGVPAAVIDDDRQLWALGQHHGMPTRLLDWTTSPYVAAYFALRDHVLAAEYAGHRVAVWARPQGVDVVSAPSMENVRLRNQGGKFTLCRAPFASLEEYVERFATDVALTKCVLPADDAQPALSDLDAMGINSYALFPDLSGLAALATMRARIAADP